LRQLKALGLRLSLDDFGTGYSSLSYLKRLPLDTLKVDRSFVHDTPQDTEATFLTRAIIAMGHSLRLEIVAEGVETAAQVALLRAMDCDILQGYHFSPAVPAEQFRELLRSASPYALPPADEDVARAGCGEAGAPLAALGTAP
jgi:EAL domain-containing protein (putative c-di-GMP-specific phosphodiesterase class I)